MLVPEVKDDDPEVKRKVNVLATTVALPKSCLLERFEERISRWKKMVRVLAYMLKFVAKLVRKAKVRNPNVFNNVKNSVDSVNIDLEINTKDYISAENLLLKFIQQRSYPDELLLYSKQNTDSSKKAKLPNSKKIKTRLWRLDPSVDEEGILRVGGRLNRTNLQNTIKHPAILPCDAIATRRLVESFHREVEHSGRTTTIGEIRQSGYWIVNISSCVRSVIYKCVPCRTLRGKLGTQKMADLPGNRAACDGPFVYSAVDMFGPFLVKEKRSEVKRYVAMFTCLSSRAVHLETTKAMSADSFIQALRRFLSRRGYVRSIRSDNGTNFVGTESELKKGWEEMDQKKVGEYLLSNKCDWIGWERNPPSASHMGGVWERQIRTIRAILNSLLRDNSTKLDDESLQTLLCEAECIVNSRPLTTDNLGDPTSEILTPNHILTMKSRVVLSPPGTFNREEIYCRKRWRAVQYLANQFWTRWKKEYLMSLQQRNKWSAAKRNFQINDVVLLKDEDSARNCWPLGRVQRVHVSDDGLVRSADVHCSGGKLTRPIHTLVLLVGAEEDFS